MSITRVGYFDVVFGAGGKSAVELLGVPVADASLKMKRKKPYELSLSFKAIMDETLLDSPLIAENKVVEWTAGFLSDNFPGVTGPRRGTQATGRFILKKIEKTYRDDGSIELKLQAMDKSIKLSDNSRPDQFANVRLSDVARLVAARTGLKAEVEESDIIYPSVVMGDEVTYGEKLLELANDEDFEFWVEGDTLHLKRARYNGTPSLVVGRTVRTAAMTGGIFLRNFSTSADYVGRSGGKKRKSGGKDKDGKPISTSTEAPLAGSGDTGYVQVTYNKGNSFTPQTMASQANASTPDNGVTTSSPIKDTKHLASKNASETKFIGLKGQKCRGTLLGALISPRDFIRVLGVDKSDSVAWLVDEATLTYKDGDLSLDFQGLIEPATRDKAKTTSKEKGDTGGDGGSGGSGGGGGSQGAVRVTYLGPGAMSVGSVTTQ